MPFTTDSNQQLSVEELNEVWPLLSHEERAQGFRALRPEEAAGFFLSRQAYGQAAILAGLSPGERRIWVRLLPPDDVTDVLQEMPEDLRNEALGDLDKITHDEVTGLLAYAEDDAGGLMSPRFARLRPEMTVDETISYLRRQVRTNPETIYYGYVLDNEQRLLGVVSMREAFASAGDKRIADIMRTDLVTVDEEMDQEAVARLFARFGLQAIPVVDKERRMKGIVTLDDIVHVVSEEATEDIHKMGGQAALDAPYLQTGVLSLVRARVGWLTILFFGGMLTSTAMAYYEDELSRALVLAVFVPLIIASGGNSGSQATTLVIRAMALGEVRLKDWWRVVRREILSGFMLGLILGLIGFARVWGWHEMFGAYEGDALGLGLTVGASLLGVVMWGTIVGSMLPFILRRSGFDPASASAPFVATLVDVFGLVIYFGAAKVLLAGTLL